MKVQKFRAKTSMEALAKVKETFGDEAVILSSKRIKDKGKWIYEITAAIDLDPPVVEQKSKEIQGFSGLLKEIEEIKALLCQLNGSLKPKNSFFYQMLAQEIPEKVLLSLDSSGSLDKNIFLKQLSNKLASKVRLEEFPQIQFFVGLGGVGKTTSAVKLAARYLYQGYRVALFSLDTVRVGAREQITRFASLLEIPLCLIRKDEELLPKLKRFQDYDYILIDTPALGSFFTLHRLSSLKEKLPNAGIHLVTRAIDAPSAALATLKKFKVYDLLSLILTHSESLVSGGPLFWILLPQVPSISFLSTGDRVPEDFERASSRRLLGLLLRNIELEEERCKL